jgi:hypothetical protein
MTIHVTQVTFDCERWEPLVEFWSQASDFAEDPENPNAPGDPEGMLVNAEQRLALLFIPVPEPKSVKNRLHLDVVPSEGTRDEEVERLLGLGATQVENHRRPDGGGWVVLADPAGNEFCVLRSAAERDAG